MAPHQVSADWSQALGVVTQGTAVDDPEQQMTRKPDDKEPLAGLAFKIMADQFQVCPPAPLPPSIALITPVQHCPFLLSDHVKQQAMLRLQVVRRKD